MIITMNLPLVYPIKELILIIQRRNKSNYCFTRILLFSLSGRLWVETTPEPRAILTQDNLPHPEKPLSL
jgi:hypothetical protein